MKGNVLIILLLASISMTAQDMSAIFSAIGEGKTSILSQYFDESIEVSINDRHHASGKVRAAEALRTFYGNIQVVDYRHQHRVDSRKQDSFYTIGKLFAADQTFRVSVYMIKRNNTVSIRELKFERIDL
jgi:hypothetical protein